jgi:hypothetical protein
MKIRVGFVSNSSSASFIIEIKDIGENKFFEEIHNEYGQLYCNLFTVTKEKFYENLNNNKKQINILKRIIKDNIKITIKNKNIKVQEDTMMYNELQEDTTPLFKALVMLFLVKLSKEYKSKAYITKDD